MQFGVWLQNHSVIAIRRRPRPRRHRMQRALCNECIACQSCHLSSYTRWAGPVPSGPMHVVLYTTWHMWSYNRYSTQHCSVVILKVISWLVDSPRVWRIVLSAGRVSQDTVPSLLTSNIVVYRVHIVFTVFISL